MSWSFHPGQRIVHLGWSEDGYEADITVNLPKEGSIYTLADICTFPAGTETRCNGTFALAVEVTCVRLSDFEPNTWWPAELFRPLTSSRLDQFRVHLAPKPREKADAV